MKIFKQAIKLTGVLIAISCLFMVIKLMINKYTYSQDIDSLDNTVLSIEISTFDLEEAKTLEQGQIQSKRLIDLSTIELYVVK